MGSKAEIGETMGRVAGPDVILEIPACAGPQLHSSTERRLGSAVRYCFTSRPRTISHLKMATSRCA